tara:strand:- start:9 stop:917 length:909 start_codon:yes stop_codon:yes gene_type:complete
MDLKSKIILISGPTASGKTKFAISIAKKIDGEIINSDSMQVYKELKVLTARPKIKDQNKIKHHLFGFQNVKKNFSTGQWLKLALLKIKEIKKRKKVPILVGGTGLYFKSITDGLSKIPKIPINIRNKVRKKQKTLGQKNFYKQLIKIDPLVKDWVNPNDVQRSVRAYEIKYFTKISIINWFKKTISTFKEDELFKIYIDYPRGQLLKKIEERIEIMLKQGAINEVKRFNKLKVKKANSSTKVIGIKEISEYLKKLSNIDQTKERMAIKTRQYAKRQTTWARQQMVNWQKINPENLDSFIKKI